jgi:hypothetical protein
MPKISQLPPVGEVADDDLLELSQATAAGWQSRRITLDQLGGAVGGNFLPLTGGTVTGGTSFEQTVIPTEPRMSDNVEIGNLTDWLQNYTNWFYINTHSSLVVRNPIGSTSIVGAARTEDGYNDTNAAIGVAGFGFQYDTASSQSTWGFYGQANRIDGAGPAIAIELDAVELGTSIALNPYNIDGATSFSVSAWLVSGGGLNAGLPAHTPIGDLTPNTAASAAVISNNGARYHRGITFHYAALEGSNGADADAGSGTAIALARTHNLAWYARASSNTGVEKFTFGSRITLAGGVQSLIASDGGLVAQTTAFAINGTGAAPVTKLDVVGTPTSSHLGTTDALAYIGFAGPGLGGVIIGCGSTGGIPTITASRTVAGTALPLVLATGDTARVTIAAAGGVTFAAGIGATTAAFSGALTATTATFSGALTTTTATINAGNVHVDRTGDGAAADIYLSSDPGFAANINLRGGATPTNRWTIAKNNTEPGTPSGNTGADLVITAHSDAGGSLGAALTITRATLASTFGGNVITPASTTARAGLTIAHGAAPTTPNNGDMWTTTAGVFIRINGTTKTFTTT